MYVHIVPVLDVLNEQFAPVPAEQLWHHCACIDVEVPLLTPVYVLVHPPLIVPGSLMVPSAVFQPTNVYPLRVGADGNTKLPSYVQLPLLIEPPLFSSQFIVIVFAEHAGLAPLVAVYPVLHVGVYVHDGYALPL